MESQVGSQPPPPPQAGEASLSEHSRVCGKQGLRYFEHKPPNQRLKQKNTQVSLQVFTAWTLFVACTVNKERRSDDGRLSIDGEGPLKQRALAGAATTDENVPMLVTSVQAQAEHNASA